ncbi:hypothetical protein IV498_18375 [Paenarthrobacter sp. Z7-10]|uniref:hypothetical protein n=1 Tax=Paenarthrobacter sp. Z7-10 TaxID=2787635 RepID=UPI0022A97849|nr:hypothetical protein [Paenarthrobacter sp. Z7-10]MCZ2405066.1 hypothetical protein [Paenarthrobacter sp. Z7-10]
MFISPRQIHAELEQTSNRGGDHLELLIIDESECLNTTALELLRDRYDRTT